MAPLKATYSDLHKKWIVEHPRCGGIILAFGSSKKDAEEKAREKQQS